MKKGTYLIEISSEKSKVVSSLSKMPDKINPICIHPMFGPETFVKQSASNLTIFSIISFAISLIISGVLLVGVHNTT